MSFNHFFSCILTTNEGYQTHTHTCCFILIINFSQRFSSLLHNFKQMSARPRITNQGWISGTGDQTSRTTLFFSALVSRALLSWKPARNRQEHGKRKERRQEQKSGPVVLVCRTERNEGQEKRRKKERKEQKGTTPGGLALEREKVSC